MQSNYKKLGPYIREVSDKNDDLSVKLLLGVSISKEFIPSIANTIGTDMSRYKIVQKDQFAYGPVTSRNSDKVSIALLSEPECIISTSYTVFEIVDTQQLLPEYLMMWFRRPEFDRYARFMSHGSVRELFGWEEMCDVELPIPSIDKQREIVKEYQTVVDRIQLNEQLNQKLEETAQAIYRHWFVDFEFPMSAEYAQSIGKPELEGQPYKSSGGEMEFNDVLEQDIPVGWSSASWDELCKITSSRRVFFDDYVEAGIPFFRGKEIIVKQSCKPLKDTLYIKREKLEELSKKNGTPKEGDILLTAVGTLGVSYLVQDEDFYFKDGNLLWLRSFKDKQIGIFLYQMMQSKEFAVLIEEITIGSTQSAITIDTLKEQSVLEPSREILDTFTSLVGATISYSNLCKRLCSPLHKAQELLLSRMVLSK